MARGKKRGTLFISNLLFSQFKIGPLPATPNSGGSGGDKGGRSSRGGGERYFVAITETEEGKKQKFAFLFVCVSIKVRAKQEKRKKLCLLGRVMEATMFGSPRL
jgi:hypothetical protein